MKSNAPKQRHTVALAKRISSHNRSQDQARQGRKVKRSLHDFRDISAQQLFASGNAYDLV